LSDHSWDINYSVSQLPTHIFQHKVQNITIK